jgi:hypothetical protein
MPGSIEFAKLFQASVSDGLANTLGKTVMETVRNLLNHPFTDYAEKPAELHRELSTVFGSGAVTLEKMISKDLFQRLDLHYSNQLEFEASVNLARRDLAHSQRGSN